MVIIMLSVVSTGLRAQCAGFPATLAETNCGTGTPLTSGANINSGTYSFCGSSATPTTFSGVNLSGGNITLCGNANISGNWNSGTIVVACGATVTFPSGLLMNSNIKVVNYGRVNITGNLEFQNSNNCFYNESSTAKLYITGNLIFPQNTNQDAYLKNNGYISIGGTFNARNGGFTCFSQDGKLETVNLNCGNNCGAPNNRFTFSSSSGSAIIRYTGSATLYSSLTSSGHYAINKGASASQNSSCPGAGWGSASVATNSPAIVVPAQTTCTLMTTCFTALPVTLTAFEVVGENAHVDAYWTTASELNNDYFLLERSADGTEWETVGKILGQGNSTTTQTYGYTDENPLRGISYYRLVQTDTDGKQTISGMRSVVISPEEEFVLYPNPAKDAVSLLPAAKTQIERIAVVDASGRTVQQTVVASEGLQTLDVSAFPRGVYTVVATLSNGFTAQRRLVLF